MLSTFLLLHQMRSDPNLGLFVRTIPDDRRVSEILGDVTRSLTIFAPNNVAMEKLKETKGDFFEKHLARSAITKEDLKDMDGKRVDYEGGLFWVTRTTDGDVYVNTAKIIGSSEVVWRNGTLHVSFFDFFLNFKLNLIIFRLYTS